MVTRVLQLNHLYEPAGSAGYKTQHRGLTQKALCRLNGKHGGETKAARQYAVVDDGKP